MLCSQSHVIKLCFLQRLKHNLAYAVIHASHVSSLIPVRSSRKFVTKKEDGKILSYFLARSGEANPLKPFFLVSVIARGQLLAESCYFAIHLIPINIKITHAGATTSSAVVLLFQIFYFARNHRYRDKKLVFAKIILKNNTFRLISNKLVQLLTIHCLPIINI